jgi:hypothetical protein
MAETHMKHLVIWRAGELAICRIWRWGDGAMGRWGDGAMGRSRGLLVMGMIAIWRSGDLAI